MLLLQLSLLLPLIIGLKSQALYILNDLVEKIRLLFCCCSCSFARNYAGQGKPSQVDVDRQNF